MDKSREHQGVLLEERRRRVASWLAENVRPAAHVLAESIDKREAQEFEVRDYQIEAWVGLWEARHNGSTRELLHLAPGLGKTTVAAIDVMRYREECTQHDPPVIPRVLYVSHKHEINEQAAERFCGFMPDLEVEFFDTRKANDRPEADVTFATIQGLYSKLDTFDPQDFEYIIWDEGHHMEAATYKQVVDHFDPLFEYVITATPDRMDGKDIRDYFGEAVYSKPLAEAIAEGLLADVDYHIVFDKAIKEALKDGFNPKTLKEIKDLFDNKPPSGAIAQNIKDEIARLGLENPKTMVFCTSIIEAEEMAMELDGVAYHSESDDRRQTLSNFRSGGVRTVTTRDMFNEGIDIPDAEVVVFLRGTQSGAIFEQQLGRGLRRARGKEKVYVLDFVANIERIAKVRELSKAIQRRAREMGEKEVIEEVIILGNEDEQEQSGLRFHTRHGDFDFDKIAVDLLARFGELQGRNKYSDFVNFTNDEILELALQLSPDSPLTLPKIERLSKEKRFISGGNIVDRFGSIPEFQRACGFEVRRFSELTNEDVVAIALALSPGYPLKTTEINAFSAAKKIPGLSSIVKRFGSLENFHRACGFEPSIRTTQAIKDLNALDDDALIELANALKPGEPLTISDFETFFKNKRFVSIYTIRSRFGKLSSFNQARGVDEKDIRAKSMGYTSAEAEAMTDQEIIELALTLKQDGPLSQKEVKAFSKQGKFVSNQQIVQRFGSLVAFQKACGFEQQVDRKSVTRSLSNDDIVALALQIKPDGPLGTKEIRVLSRDGKFVSVAGLVKRFGSIVSFQRECGFEPLGKRAATGEAKKKP